MCGNTASMLANTRFSKHFKVDERGNHKGLFDCSNSASCDAAKAKSCCAGNGSCCWINQTKQNIKFNFFKYNTKINFQGLQWN